MKTTRGKADLHIHTRESDGMDSVERVLDYVERETDLDVVCITDHDDVSVGLRARDLAAQRGHRAEIVPGIEITTLEGHLLALFVEKPVPSYRPLAATIRAVHQQGGLAVVPHPMSWLVYSAGQASLERLATSDDIELRLDAIELVNSSWAGRVTRKQAQRLNRERWRLAEVGGSDAHFAVCIGWGYTTFAGATASELHQAILQRKTRPGAVAAHERKPVQPTRLASQLVRSLVVHPLRLAGRTLLQAR